MVSVKHSESSCRSSARRWRRHPRQWRMAADHRPLRSEALERIRSHAYDFFDKLIDNGREFVVIGNGDFTDTATFRFKSERTQGFANVFHTSGGDLGSLDKVALVIVTVLAAKEQGTIHTGRHGILDPH